MNAIDPSSQISVRVTVRLRNEKLLSARADLTLSQVSLANLAGVSVSMVSKLERFDFKAADRDYFVDAAARVAFAIGLDIDDVLPPELIGMRLKHTVTQIHSMRANQITVNKARFILPSPEDEAMKHDEIRLIREIIDEYFTYREAAILSLKFGYGESEPITYPDKPIARLFNMRTPAFNARAMKLERKLDSIIEARSKVSEHRKEGRQAYGNMLAEWEGHQ